MSLQRYACKRDASEPEIVSVFEAAGADVEPISKKSVPDLLVGYRGRNHLVECKSGTEILNAQQAIWHDGWAGERPEVCRNAVQALRLIEKWNAEAAVEAA